MTQSSVLRQSPFLRCCTTTSVPHRGTTPVPFSTSKPWTHGASVGLLARVRPLMRHNVALVGEAPWAHGASVRLSRLKSVVLSSCWSGVVRDVDQHCCPSCRAVLCDEVPVYGVHVAGDPSSSSSSLPISRAVRMRICAYWARYARIWDRNGAIGACRLFLGLFHGQGKD